MKIYRVKTNDTSVEFKVTNRAKEYLRALLRESDIRLDYSIFLIDVGFKYSDPVKNIQISFEEYEPTYMMQINNKDVSRREIHNALYDTGVDTIDFFFNVGVGSSRELINPDGDLVYIERLT